MSETGEELLTTPEIGPLAEYPPYLKDAATAVSESRARFRAASSALIALDARSAESVDGMERAKLLSLRPGLCAAYAESLEALRGTAEVYRTRLAAQRRKFRPHRWLVDVYRLRAAADAARGLEHGPWSQDNGMRHAHVLADFASFCRLAHSRGVVPEDWDWPATVHTACTCVSLPLSAADAAAEWGAEGDASADGAPSLSRTADRVYRCEVGEIPRDQPAKEAQAMAVAALQELVAGGKGMFAGPEAQKLFAELGGIDPWNVLARLMMGVEQARTKGMGDVSGNTVGELYVGVMANRLRKLGFVSY